MLHHECPPAVEGCCLSCPVFLPNFWAAGAPCPKPLRACVCLCWGRGANLLECPPAPRRPEASEPIQASRSPTPASLSLLPPPGNSPLKPGSHGGPWSQCQALADARLGMRSPEAAPVPRQGPVPAQLKGEASLAARRALSLGPGTSTRRLTRSRTPKGSPGTSWEAPPAPGQDSVAGSRRAGLATLCRCRRRSAPKNAPLARQQDSRRGRRSRCSAG